jgi:hypothetical protein
LGRSVSAAPKALDPGLILSELLNLDEALMLQGYYSERSVFYNPGRSAPLGVILASIKEHDGPNDARSNLNRPGVYRFAFQLSREDYEARFGRVPPRPARGEFVRVDQEVSTLNVLTPHPIYAWMRWVQVLSPSRRTFDSLLPVLEESLVSVKARWEARAASR